MWKIVFSYKDNSNLIVSGNHKVLPFELAVKYQSQYAKPSNDGGMVYISPYKNNTPISLDEYINR